METEHVVLMRGELTKSFMVMVKSFHYINVMCFCNVWYVLVIKQCVFVNVNLRRVKPSLLQM